MKTGKPIISLIRHKTYLSCRASEQAAAISVTDKLEVFVAKIQSGLMISCRSTCRRVKEDVLCFIIQELEQVAFDFQTLNNSFNHQVTFFNSFRPILSVSVPSQRQRRAGDLRIGSSRNIGHYVLCESLNIIWTRFLCYSRQRLGDDIEAVSADEHGSPHAWDRRSRV
jgi:hypothetical protein